MRLINAVIKEHKRAKSKKKKKYIEINYKTSNKFTKIYHKFPDFIIILIR